MCRHESVSGRVTPAGAGGGGWLKSGAARGAASEAAQRGRRARRRLPRGLHRQRRHQQLAAALRPAAARAHVLIDTLVV